MTQLLKILFSISLIAIAGCQITENESPTNRDKVGLGVVNLVNPPDGVIEINRHEDGERVYQDFTDSTDDKKISIMEGYYSYSIDGEDESWGEEVYAFGGFSVIAGGETTLSFEKFNRVLIPNDIFPDRSDYELFRFIDNKINTKVRVVIRFYRPHETYAYLEDGEYILSFIRRDTSILPHSFKMEIEKGKVIRITRTSK